ncbi:zinc ribbon domain-containing protein, partial [Mitsuokella multacida]|uniref:zinc ribbon domain-containing protein n=1 Tax=Mitsuokella multacida TaxID=52226 RepID=UPI0022DFA72B
FFRQLTYKTELHGGELLKVDTFYPSSQTCSVCCYQNPLTKYLSVREWDCPACGTHHDRDVNAAKNIGNSRLGRSCKTPIPRRRRSGRRTKNPLPLGIGSVKPLADVS